MEDFITQHECDYGNDRMASFGERIVVCYVTPPRLDDRIRQLCSRVISAGDESELAPAISELKAALREHNERLRKFAAGKLGMLWTSPKHSSS